MESGISKICPICRNPLTEADAVVTCPVCGVTQHSYCWNANGGCSTVGCPNNYNAANQQPVVAPVCANCGAPLAEGQPFCANCGTPAGAVQPPVPAPAPKKKFPVIPVVIGAVVLAIIIAAVILLSGPKVDRVDLSESDLDMRVGDVFSVVCTIEPQESNKVEVTWSSSDTSVATVDKNGNIRAVGAGTCTITATAGGKSDTVRVEAVVLYPEEEKVVGDWSTIGMDTGDGQFQSIPSYAGEFIAREDFTGEMSAGDTVIEFTWEFVEKSDDLYLYRAKMKDGGSFQFFIGELLDEDSIIVVLKEVKVIYQK